MNQSSEWSSLPRQLKDREKLKKAILLYAKKLYDFTPNENIQKIDRLKLRLSLIDGCNNISLIRLGHLQEIFKHYCTHIYRTGKYMTFDRLQHEKIHMNMDRFFLFLKDFELSSAEINGNETEVVDKKEIVTIFKKTSSTSKSLNFQEFVAAIEKIGSIYFDEKEGYTLKKQRLKQEKARKRQQYERKKKLKLLKRSEIKADQGQKQAEQSQEAIQQNQQPEKAEQQPEKDEKQQKKSENLQNDKLVEDMMKDERLEDPNEEVEKKVADTKEQGDRGNQDRQQEEVEENPYLNLADNDVLLALSKNQKVQFFYRKLGIDSVVELRARLSDLNLPIYNHYKEGPKSKKREVNQDPKKIEEIKNENSVSSIINLQEQERVRALKELLSEKKSKEKAAPIPKPRKEGPANIQFQQGMLKRKELKKEREIKAKQIRQDSDQVLQKRMDQKRVPFGSDKKRVDFDEKQISWNVMNLSLQQLHLKQFNPNKFFVNEDEDRIFLDEYMDRGRNKGPSGLGIRDRHSASLVDGLKKRVNQIEKSERRNQKKLNNISKRIGLGQLVRERF